MSAQTIIGRLLPEWLNSNQHRAYPLGTDTAGNGLPSSFLIDAFFITSPSVDRERVYISSVVRNTTNILIKLGGYVDGSSVDFGIVATIPFSTTSGSEIPVSLTGPNYTLAGSFIIGDTQCMESVPAVLEFDEDQGRIFPGCVRNETDTMKGLKINDTVYTGIVTLEAGEGIEFDISFGEEEEGETILKITSKAYTKPDENSVIVSDATLLSNAMELYGTPVRTICGVYPDPATGDIVFSTPAIGEGVEQCVAAAGTGVGAVYLTIANDETNVACTDHSEQIESLLQSLSNLNERSVEIAEGITAADEAISNLALQVSRS